VAKWAQDRELLAIIYEEFAQAIRHSESIEEMLTAADRILPAGGEMMDCSADAVRRATKAALDEAGRDAP
jgi:hypothetical protein